MLGNLEVSVKIVPISSPGKMACKNVLHEVVSCERLRKS